MAAHESTNLCRKQAPMGNLYPQNCSCNDGRPSIWLPKRFSRHHSSCKGWCEIFTYLSCHISKGGVCIQCPNAREQFVFFLIEKSFFALTESHQQQYHITAETRRKCPPAGRWFDTVQEKANATTQETSHRGHRGSGTSGLFQAYLDSTFWWWIYLPSCVSLEGQIPMATLFWIEAIWQPLTQLSNQVKMTHPTLFGIWTGRQMTFVFCQKPRLFNVL